MKSDFCVNINLWKERTLSPADNLIYLEADKKRQVT